MDHKRRINILPFLALLFLVAGTSYAQAEEGEGEDRTLSPYFFVQSDDPEVDRLPLESTSVDVNISGVIADVTVAQVYKNEGRNPIEAVYIFPASTRAAVYGMKMTIGERTITAKIRERAQARKEYEQARQQGKSASLLEQQRPNVFQMNVANIMPLDVIKVELKYTELLVPTDSVYDFVYPTVVGPRYSNKTLEQAGPSETWIENPYLHEGEAPTYTFDISVSLATGLPIQDIACASHKIDVDYEGSDLAAVRLDPEEKYGGNRDFLLKYRLAGDRIQTGLLLYEGNRENFFLLMMQPPKRVSQDQIPPREYIFIVDVSGSMRGFPLDISKKLLEDLIRNLRPVDKFNVLLFAGGSSIMSRQSLPAVQANVDRAVNMINGNLGGGGTELLPALKRALALPATEGYSRTIVIATDGYVSVEEEAFDLIRSNLNQANMFAFGIGSSVNRFLIEGMARVGMGEPFIITRPEQAREKAGSFRELIQSPVLTGIQVDFGDFEVFDVEPPTVPDLLAQRPLILFGKWHGHPGGIIRLRGTTGESVFTQEIHVADVRSLERNSALPYLWARQKVAILSDYNRLRQQDERIKEVTGLGLAYNLLTAYTSFVAVDTLVRTNGGNATTVRQPLPLPQGVSNYAVSGSPRRSLAAPLHGPADAAKSRPKSIAYRVREEKVLQETSRSDVEADEAEARLGWIPLKLGKVTVTGGLSVERIRELLEKRIDKINECYAKGSPAEFSAAGDLVFELVLDARGRVKKVNAVDLAGKHAALEKCIAKQLKALQFPAPVTGSKTTIKVGFTTAERTTTR